MKFKIFILYIILKKNGWGELLGISEKIPIRMDGDLIEI